MLKMLWKSRDFHLEIIKKIFLYALLSGDIHGRDNMMLLRSFTVKVLALSSSNYRCRQAFIFAVKEITFLETRLLLCYNPKK